MKKKDVQDFSFYLEDNLLDLHHDIFFGNYEHDKYDSFYICDPKRRHIHKVSVRDRVIHQAIFRSLYHLFDQNFIYDSYSCRLKKGTHKAVKRLMLFSRRVSLKHYKNAYVLKCDIVKFFASVDQKILLNLIYMRVVDKKLIVLIKKIVRSFETDHLKGLPLGNVTSQLFANIYLNELDRFVKHTLKAKYYIRYCDDFVILYNDKKVLKEWKNKIENFLISNLKLSIHKDRASIRKISLGIDFLGYVVLPHHVVVRSSTKRRILKRVNVKNIDSYLGICSHANSFRLRQEILKSVAEQEVNML